MKVTRKAIGVTAALWSLFLMVYPVCNWITSLRTHVPAVYFRWENHVPFVPALIVPYLSIDLFFFIAPFVATTNRELRTYALRISLAIVLAGACFLLFPLKFGWSRPPVDGLLGLVFAEFRNMDLPFNQCPSLHIAFLVIMLELYLRHTRGVWKTVTFIWFSLIFISTVLTYQHHAIDVGGGLILATFCFFAVRDQSHRQPFTPMRSTATGYLIAACGFIAAAFSFTPWSCILLSPALSLLLVAGGYAVVGPGLYRKESGRLPISSWLVLWPVLTVHHMKRAFGSRADRPYDRLTDELWIGRSLSNQQAQQAIAAGVTAVIDLSCECAECPSLLKLDYLHLPVLHRAAPDDAQIQRAIDFISERAEDGIVYLHSSGEEASTAIIAGIHLLATEQVETPSQAIARLRLARASISNGSKVINALREYHARHQSMDESRTFAELHS